MLCWERNAFGYKDMEERMGPVIANAPARVLDLLSPLPMCDHDEQYCRRCGAEIFEGPSDTWRSEAKPGQRLEVAGPRCYSGYPLSARVEGAPPAHAPGGVAPCGTCWARAWRQRCREALAAYADRRRILTDGSTVRLVNADTYNLPDHIKHDPTFVVVRDGRKLRFRHGLTHYRFSATAEWECTTNAQTTAS